MIKPTFEFNYDLICCGMTLEYASGRKFESSKEILLEPYECRDASGFVKGFDILYKNNNTIASTCNKLFKKDALDQFGIVFDTSLTNREDTKFCYTFLTKANSLLFIEKPFYHYLSRRQDASLSDTFAPHSVVTADFLINCISDIIERMNVPKTDVLDKSIYYTSGLYNENAVWLKKYCKIAEPIETSLTLERIFYSDYTKTCQKSPSGKLLLGNYLAEIYSIFIIYLRKIANIPAADYFDYFIASNNICSYLNSSSFLPLFLIHQELKDEKQFDLALLPLASLLSNGSNVNKIPHYGINEFIKAVSSDYYAILQLNIIKDESIENHLAKWNLGEIIKLCENQTDFGHILLKLNCLILSGDYIAAIKLCWQSILEYGLKNDELLIIKKRLEFISEKYKQQHNAKLLEFIFGDSNMLEFISKKDYSAAYNYTARYIKSNSSQYNIYIYNLLLARIAGCAKNISLAAQGYIEGVLSPLNKAHSGKEEFIDFLKENNLSELLNELQAILNSKQ